jgi:hypothetical protein
LLNGDLYLNEEYTGGSEFVLSLVLKISESQRKKKTANPKARERIKKIVKRDESDLNLLEDQPADKLNS